MYNLLIDAEHEYQFCLLYNKGIKTIASGNFEIEMCTSLVIATIFGFQPPLTRALLGGGGGEPPPPPPVRFLA